MSITAKPWALRARPQFVAVFVATALVAAGVAAYVFFGEPTASATPVANLTAPAVHPAAVERDRVAQRVKTIRITASVPIAQAQDANNRCDGPIAYQWGPTPSIVTQHNYCGGTALVAVAPGETVRLIGGGLDGLYRVSASRHYIDGYGPVTQFRRAWGDVVLATCVSSTHEVAIGLDRLNA